MLQALISPFVSCFWCYIARRLVVALLGSSRSNGDHIQGVRDPAQEAKHYPGLPGQHGQAVPRTIAKSNPAIFRHVIRYFSWVVRPPEQPPSSSITQSADVASMPVSQLPREALEKSDCWCPLLDECPPPSVRDLSLENPGDVSQLGRPHESKNTLEKQDLYNSRKAIASGYSFDDGSGLPGAGHAPPLSTDSKSDQVVHRSAIRRCHNEQPHRLSGRRALWSCEGGLLQIKLLANENAICGLALGGFRSSVPNRKLHHRKCLSLALARSCL